MAFDGHAFTSPAGGVRRYVTGLTSALLDQADPAELSAVGVDANTALPPGIRAIEAASSLPTNLGWCVDGLPRACRTHLFDVFHAPAYTAPLRGVHPLVVTIHDVSYERHPEWYPYRSGRLRRWFYRRSALVADVVITDSEFSRREIQAAYGIAAARIVVVPLGVGRPFEVGRHGHWTEREEPPFILHVGDLHARRNVGVLVDALALLRGRTDLVNRTELVLAGVDRGAAAEIGARARACGVADAVRFLTDQNDHAVVDLMQRAAVLAYPSLYEGFGLPALESMACGTPVIGSTAASIPEVVGEAGLLVSPSDVRAWHDALVAVIASRERASDMRRAGLARAEGFTWERTAAHTAAIYRNLAARQFGA